MGEHENLSLHTAPAQSKLRDRVGLPPVVSSTSHSSERSTHIVSDRSFSLLLSSDRGVTASSRTGRIQREGYSNPYTELAANYRAATRANKPTAVCPYRSALEPAENEPFGQV